MKRLIDTLIPISVVLALATMFLAPSEALAVETMNRVEGGEMRAYTGFGLDGAWAVPVGFAYSQPIPAINRDLELIADVTLPILALARRNFAAQVATRITIVEHKGFGIRNRLALEWVAAENATFTADGIGFDEALSFGYFGQSWFVALDAGYDRAFGTHLEHSKAYKETFPGAKDGWYQGTAGHFRFSAQAGYTIKDRVELSLRVGIPISERGKLPSNGMPLFAYFGTTAHFGGDLEK